MPILRVESTYMRFLRKTTFVQRTDFWPSRHNLWDSWKI